MALNQVHDRVLCDMILAVLSRDTTKSDQMRYKCELPQSHSHLKVISSKEITNQTSYKKMATRELMVFLAVVLLMKVSSTVAVPCGTVGICTDTKGDCINSVCYCRPEFMGTDCNTGCDPCTNTGEVCVVNATMCGACNPGCDANKEKCATVDTTATCRCIDGLSGTNCETITCGNNNISPCLNNGTCADGACTCTKNFAGTICELECTTACGENEQCEVVDNSPQCNHGVTAVVTPALIASLLIMLGFL